jgi:hypothetical protein
VLQKDGQDSTNGRRAASSQSPRTVPIKTPGLVGRGDAPPRPEASTHPHRGDGQHGERENAERDG